MTGQSKEEIRIPEAQIEEIARKAFNPDLVDLTTRLDGIKRDIETRAKKQQDVGAQVEALQATVQEITRVRRDGAFNKAESEYQGLWFNPDDANDPVVRHFGLKARKDCIPKGHAVLPGVAHEARGLGLRAGLYMKAMFMANSRQCSIEDALKALDADWLVKQLNAWVEREQDKNVDRVAPITVQRALGTINATSGGTLIPFEISEEVVELLRSTTTFLEAGPNEIRMGPNGINFKSITAPSVAQYKTESASINSSQMTTGALTMVRHDLYGIVAASDHFLMVPGTEAINRNEMVQTMSQKIDFTGLRGDGAQDTPMGLRTWATDGSNPDRVFASASADNTPTAVEIIEDVRELESRLAQSNITGDRLAMFMNTRTKHAYSYFYDTSAGTPGFLFRDEVRATRLGSARLFASNQIPNNLGAGSDSDITLAAMEHIWHGLSEDMTFDVFPGGAYNNSSGSLVSGISVGETVIRARMSHDIRPRYREAITVLTGVKY